MDPIDRMIIQEMVKEIIGNPDDTGGTATEGTVTAKLNAVITAIGEAESELSEI